MKEMQKKQEIEKIEEKVPKKTETVQNIEKEEVKV